MICLCQALCQAHSELFQVHSKGSRNVSYCYDLPLCTVVCGLWKMITLTVYVEEVEAKYWWRRKISEPGMGVLSSVLCLHLPCWLGCMRVCVCSVAKMCLALCDPMDCSLPGYSVHGIPWTVAHQSPLSLGFPRQEHWSGLPFASPRDLPDPGIETTFSALAGRFFTTEPPGKCIPWLASVSICVLSVDFRALICTRRWASYCSSLEDYKPCQHETGSWKLQGRRIPGRDWVQDVLMCALGGDGQIRLVPVLKELVT